MLKVSGGYFRRRLRKSADYAFDHIFKSPPKNIIMGKTADKKAGKNRVWPWMVLSYFIPILGGVIAYFVKRRGDGDLAIICALGSLVLPMTAGVSFMLGVLSTIYYGDAFSGYVLSLIYWIIAGLFLHRYITKQALPENKYRYFFLVYWFALLGALYSYYNAYKNDKNLRDNVGWFFFFQLFLGIFGSMFLSTLLLSMVLK